MQSLKQKFVWPLVAAMAITGVSFMGVELAHPQAAQAQSAQAQVETARPTPTPQTDSIATAIDLGKAFRAVHASLKDAVVNINVVKHTAGVRGGRGIPPELRQMLPPGFDPDQMGGGSQDEEGTGSGVVVSADGYILTNNHVVSDATDIQVRLNDGRELKAELVGTDPKTDLAVVRIKADHLTFAKFGDSDGLDVGDWVLAFGSPFGFDQTMTQGIISAKGRHVPIIAQHDPNLQGLTYENFLQTDAAINPGNSGGPLVNLKGEVVGINAAIASSSGGYNGIGFSIPSNDAQYIMKSLIEHGKVVRGYLGILIDDAAHPIPADEALMKTVRGEGFTGDKGVLVGDVNPGEPAAKAGLKSGDVILAVNGKPVGTRDDFRNMVARTVPDSKLELTLFRGGKTEKLPVTVGTQPDTLRSVAMDRGATDRGAAGRTAGGGDAMDSKDLGISVEDLSASQAKRYGVKSGAIVSKVDASGLAADMGLHPGDVITKLDKTDVSSAKQFNDALNSAKLSDGVKLLVRSDDGVDRMVYIEKK